MSNKSFFGLFLMIYSMSAYAYIGPGAGLSALGSVLAFIGAILLLVIGFFWYPIKRFFKARKEKSMKREQVSETESDADIENHEK